MEPIRGGLGRGGPVLCGQDREKPAIVVGVVVVAVVVVVVVVSYMIHLVDMSRLQQLYVNVNVGERRQH